MRFRWDPAKATKNREKHGTTFDEASTVFLDTLSITGADPDHSESEERWITFGVSALGNFLVVSHIDDADVVRIIGARPGLKSERKLYEEG